MSMAAPPPSALLQALMGGQGRPQVGPAGMGAPGMPPMAGPPGQVQPTGAFLHPINFGNAMPGGQPAAAGRAGEIPSAESNGPGSPGVGAGIGMTGPLHNLLQPSPGLPAAPGSVPPLPSSSMMFQPGGTGAGGPFGGGPPFGGSALPPSPLAQTAAGLPTSESGQTESDVNMPGGLQSSLLGAWKAFSAANPEAAGVVPPGAVQPAPPPLSRAGLGRIPNSGNQPQFGQVRGQ